MTANALELVRMLWATRSRALGAVASDRICGNPRYVKGPTELTECVWEAENNMNTECSPLRSVLRADLCVHVFALALSLGVQPNTRFSLPNF